MRERSDCSSAKDKNSKVTEEARIVFIAGPTASGKSAAALALAEKIGAEIVNADAMQVYRDLEILTARPCGPDLARAPHHLYGSIDGAERFSAGRWARAAADLIAEIGARGRPVIVIGGTGLYFKALAEGLSPIPEIDPAMRKQASERRRTLGAEAFRDEVVAADPQMAHLPVADVQRLMRAWEVFHATGTPLSAFQARPRRPLAPAPTASVVIAPPREALYEKIDARATEMIEGGAVEEVCALLERGLDPNMPVMKALGVAEIAAMLSGDASQEDATAALQQSTRRFAKRQLTWFRNQAADWPRADDVASATEVLLAAFGCK
ncbi:MAG: tRNA (adenosine(37)-N6)-dimethylallyltransferase MiaA [Pseudomonadota bacterium]